MLRFDVRDAGRASLTVDDKVSGGPCVTRPSFPIEGVLDSLLTGLSHDRQFPTFLIMTWGAGYAATLS
jgi:hypothetical protein